MPSEIQTTAHDMSHWRPAAQCSKPDDCQHPYCRCPRVEDQNSCNQTTRWPDGYIKQLEVAWLTARDDLRSAAARAREAQTFWQSAVDREMEASRRYASALKTNGEMKELANG